MRVYAGVPFRLERHLERLVASAGVLGLPLPDPATLAALAAEAVAAAGVPAATLRVVWTAGREGEERGQGFALVTPLPDGLDDLRRRGIRLAALQLAIGAHVRQTAPWLLPGVKSTSYAVNMAAQREARRRGADDAVFVSAEGIVLEGPTSNVWFREGGVLLTPALELGILAGVTRDTLLDAVAGAGYEVREGAFPLERLAAADEAFTSSSIREVMGVVELDGRPLGGGPGPCGRCHAGGAAGRRGLAGSERAGGHPVPGGDVLALQRVREPPGPHHLHHRRHLRRRARVHAGLERQPVALAVVAAAAGRDNVVPGVLAAPRERLDVVDRQVGGAAVAAAVGAAPAVPAEQDPPDDVAPHDRPQLDVGRHLEDDRQGDGQALRAVEHGGLLRDHLRVPAHDHTDGPLAGDERHRSHRRVQQQTAHCTSGRCTEV